MLEVEVAERLQALPAAVISVSALVVLVLASVGTHWWLRRNLAGNEFADRAETKLWFVLAAVTPGLSLASGVMLVPRFAALVGEATPLQVAAACALLLAAGLLFGFGPRSAMGPLPSPLPRHGRRVLPVFVLTGLGLLPATGGMVLIGIRAQGTSAEAPDALRQGIDELVQHRNDLQLYLSVAAFVVVATIVTTAALRRALIAHEARVDYPPSHLLAYGAFFSALIAIAFVPAFFAIEARANEIVRTIVPLDDPDFPEDSWFEQRSNLSQLLGSDTSLVGAFAAAFAVLIPVASSALAAYLQKDIDAAPAAADPSRGSWRARRPGTARAPGGRRPPVRRPPAAAPAVPGRTGTGRRRDGRDDVPSPRRT